MLRNPPGGSFSLFTGTKDGFYNIFLLGKNILFIHMSESKSRGRRPELTKLSSKGQVVIPKEIREKLGLKEGTPLAIEATDTGLVVIKEIKSPVDEEDIKALKEVTEAWERIERGEYRKAKVDDFLKEIEEW